MEVIAGLCNEPNFSSLIENLVVNENVDRCDSSYFEKSESITSECSNKLKELSTEANSSKIISNSSEIRQL